MWVRSQDKKLLANYISFSVTSNFASKKKGVIMGTISENGFWGSETKVLGLYDTMDIAVDELAKLQFALINDTKVYEMS